MAITRNTKVIGLGGIGAVVAEGLAMFLGSERVRSTLWLVDGDSYEDANRDRVRFDEDVNKAESKARELSQRARGDVTILPIPKYVTPNNARDIIENDDVVFLCVDNHNTRRTVSRRCRKLDDVLLLSGGNDGIENGRSGTFGNVMVYRRSGGNDITHPLTRFHPEIALPRDKRPDQLSCVELAKSSAPQLLFTNWLVASAMLATFYSSLEGALDFEELYLDVSGVKLTTVDRRSPSSRGAFGTRAGLRRSCGALPRAEE